MKFACPHCSKSLNVKDELVGKRGKCPGCGEAITIPPREISVEGATDKPCPDCGASMASDAVVCIECGLDLRTGRRIPAPEVGVVSDPTAGSTPVAEEEPSRVLCSQCGKERNREYMREQSNGELLCRTCVRAAARGRDPAKLFYTIIGLAGWGAPWRCVVTGVAAVAALVLWTMTAQSPGNPFGAHKEHRESKVRLSNVTGSFDSTGDFIWVVEAVNTDSKNSAEFGLRITIESTMGNLHATPQTVWGLGLNPDEFRTFSGRMPVTDLRPRRGFGTVGPGHLVGQSGQVMIEAVLLTGKPPTLNARGRK